MGNPRAEIETTLKRAVVTQDDANRQRKDLNDSFRRLGQDEAALLLEALLTLDGSRLPTDFRRLHRAVRLELVEQLAQRLGTQTSSNLHGRLSTGPSADPKARKGLMHMFPEYTAAQRAKFLQALVRETPTGVPSVLLEFRSRDGEDFSPDNKAVSLGFRKPYEPNRPHKLGLNPIDGTNWMEIRGTVSGHRPDAEYQFRRTIEEKSWIGEGSSWRYKDDPKPAGTDDDANDSDEDLHADNDHIYVIDSPGLTGPIRRPNFVENMGRAQQSKATEAVFMMNAIETVHVKVGAGTWVDAGQLEWFTVTWLEKVGDTWRRKQGSNKIERGSIANLDSSGPDDGPPTAF